MIELQKTDQGRFRKSVVIADLIKTHCPNKNIKIVELGVYDGLNMQAIAMLLNQHKYTIDYVGFDFFEDAKDIDLSKTNPGVHENLHQDANFYLKMHVNTIRSLLQSLCLSVTLIKGDIEKLLPQSHEAKNADMYYIDGAHTYEAVEHNYMHIEKNAKNHCLVIFDDVDHPEIRRFIKGLSDKVKVTIVGSMGYTIISK